MKRKWIKRSDRILQAMIIMWFVGAAWGMIIVSLQFGLQIYQTLKSLQSVGDYYGYGSTINIDINSVLIYIGAPVGGGIVTWLIKNMIEATTANKLNPDYLKTHLPEDEDII